MASAVPLDRLFLVEKQELDSLIRNLISSLQDMHYMVCNNVAAKKQRQKAEQAIENTVTETIKQVNNFLLGSRLSSTDTPWIEDIEDET